MGLVNIKDFETQVWDSDKELLSISAFRSIKEKYGNEAGDLIVKAVYILEDPTWGKRKYMSDSEIKAEAHLFFEKAGVSADDVLEFQEYYVDHVLTDLERELIAMEKLVRDRSDYFHKLKYEVKTEASTKDKMALNHKDFVSKLKELREQVDQSSSGSSTYGNYNKSLAEGGFQ